MRTITATISIFTVTLSLASIAGAQNIFDETFEAYTLGDSNGLGGWVDFGGVRTANIVNTRASSGT